MIFRYASYLGSDTDIDAIENLNDFSDAIDVSRWAIPAMKWAIDAELVQGRGGNKIAPKEFATRAETAIILTRLTEAYS